MKKKNRKAIILAVITLIVIFGVGFQYRRINEGVPRKFNTEKYSIGEVVKLDNFEVIVNGIKEIEDEENYEATMQTIYNLYEIDLTIKNISNEEQSLKSFYKGVLYNDRRTSEIPLEIEGGKMEKSLGSKEEIKLKLTHNLLDVNKKEPVEYHFSKDLYLNDIKRDIEKLMYNEKYVESL